jgi:predicted enzyme related to lactoylglutathione lyase
MQPTIGHGKICYLEIPSTDVQRSATFYEKVFGWKIRKRGDGATAFDDGVGEVSGSWRRDRKASSNPGTIVHIMVDNLDAAIQGITSNGGRIVQPPGADAPELTAHFADPDGNVFGIYQEPVR